MNLPNNFIGCILIGWIFYDNIDKSELTREDRIYWGKKKCLRMISKVFIFLYYILCSSWRLLTVDYN